MGQIFCPGPSPAEFFEIHKSTKSILLNSFLLFILLSPFLNDVENDEFLCYSFTWLLFFTIMPFDGFPAVSTSKHPPTYMLFMIYSLFSFLLDTPSIKYLYVSSHSDLLGRLCPEYSIVLPIYPLKMQICLH